MATKNYWRKQGWYFNELSNQELIPQLQQLTHMTFDGDLIGKADRDYWVERGMAIRVSGGWNIINAAGIEYLEKLKFIHP